MHTNTLQDTKLNTNLLFGWFEVVAEEAELEKVRKCVEDTCDPADCRRTLRMWPPWWPPLLFEAVAVEDKNCILELFN